MDLARLRSNISFIPVLTILVAVYSSAGMAAATPPTSELNGVARITLNTDAEVPPAVDSGDSDPTPAPSEELVAIAETTGSPREPDDSSDLEEERDSDEDVAMDASTDETSRTVVEAVLSNAGEIASFDRTPIFGRPGKGSNGTAPITPPTSATGGAGDGSWWNAPELRVFGLLAVLVLAAVFVKRHGGRGIGLAGGPRPSGVVSVLGRFPFGRSASLVLLECGPKVILLHQHAGKGGEVSTLAEFSDLEEVADLRRRLSASERDAKGGFGRELEQTLGLYDRRGRPRGFGGEDGLPVQGPIETVDLTRRRPRRGVRGN